MKSIGKGGGKSVGSNWSGICNVNALGTDKQVLIFSFNLRVNVRPQHLRDKAKFYRYYITLNLTLYL